MSEIVKARDVATSLVSKQNRKLKMLGARTDLVKDKVDFLKTKVSTECNMEVVRRKVAGAKSEMNNLGNGLHSGTSDSCGSIRHIVGRSLLAVGSHLRNIIDREAKELLWGVHAASLDAAGRFRSRSSVPMKLLTEA